MKLEAYSTKGVRKSNQDSYLAVELDINGKNTVVMIVCDGMGGTANGSYASGVLIKNIEESILQGNYEIDYIDKVAKSIHKELSVLPKEESAGTTLTYLWTDNTNYEIYHVGDSRCYSIKDGKYTQITEDHSVREDAKRGFFGAKSEKLLNCPEHYLSRCIGLGHVPIPFIKKGVLTDEDGFLICSDGFWHNFNPNNDFESLEEACNNVIFSGENDNVTVLRFIR